jgi:two-component system LytT family response regulator
MNARAAALRGPGSIRVLVVDDEPLARSGLRKLIGADPDLEWAGEARGGKAAVDAIRTRHPDIVLLDVQMPGLDGFGVVDAIGHEQMPVTVFVTAHDQHALRAFKASAVDYLMKPFDDEQFAAAMTRAKRAVRRDALEAMGDRLFDLLRAARPAGSGHFLARIAVKERDRTVLVAVEDVDWIEAADYYVKVHAGGKCWFVHTTLASLEAQLAPTSFFRLHRSAIVNLSRISELRPGLRGEHVVVLRDGTRLRLPRRRRKNLQSRLRVRV